VRRQVLGILIDQIAQHRFLAEIAKAAQVEGAKLLEVLHFSNLDLIDICFRIRRMFKRANALFYCYD
jgi:hypothetical protein